LRGGAGNDLFGVDGGGNEDPGADTFDGGDGIDNLQYNLTSGKATVTLGEGGVFKTVVGPAGSSGDKITNIENFFGGGGAVYIVNGNSLANTIEADVAVAGNVLKGLGGDDRLFGGTSDDTLDGGD